MEFKLNEKVQKWRITKNVSIIIQFFCNVEVLQCFWPLNELPNVLDARKYISSTITHFNLFDSEILGGKFSGRPNQYTGL